MYIVHFPTAWWDFNLFYHLTNQTLDLTAWNGFENDFTFVKKFKFLTTVALRGESDTEMSDFTMC